MQPRSTVDPTPFLSSIGDPLGLDRMARALLRTVVRLPKGSVVLVQGAPGSGKDQLLLQCAALLRNARHTVGFDAMSPAGPWAWYNPWLFQKNGNILAGLVVTLGTRTDTPMGKERARDIINHLNRMHFGDDMPSTTGTSLDGTYVNPVERVRRSFSTLIEALKAGSQGRALVFIQDLDLLRPDARLLLLEGLRLMATSDADVTFVVAMGRKSALEAIRAREGAISDGDAEHCLAQLVDLALTVPPLHPDRVDTLLRARLQGSEALIRRAFGPDGLDALIAAARDPAMGQPRVVERLAGRVTLLSELVAGTSAARELSEAQWSWIVVGERWPDFRRFMLRGGRQRWAAFRQALGASTVQGAEDLAPDVGQWLRRDPLLADYMRRYGPELEREADSVYWLEGILLAAGL